MNRSYYRGAISPDNDAVPAAFARRYIPALAGETPPSNAGICQPAAPPPRSQVLPLLALFLAILFLASGNPGDASAQDSPVGSWAGVIVDSQRNIPVTLTVTALHIGAQNGEMRWGAPRTCSLRTEYAGRKEDQYVLNISGSNGGWCDLYRDGQLLLRITANTPSALQFNLSDKQGGGLVSGALTPKP